MGLVCSWLGWFLGNRVITKLEWRNQDSIETKHLILVTMCNCETFDTPNRNCCLYPQKKIVKIKINKFFYKMSLLSVVKQTYDSFPSFPVTGCTIDGFGEDRDHCVPQIAKDYKLLVISNITLVIIIGGFGNLFNIVAICVARVRYILFLLLYNC